MEKELVMYTRTLGCPFVTIAKRVLGEHNVPYREILIDRDPLARNRVKTWTGFLSVPTLVVTEPGGILPIEEPAPLEKGTSPQGIDRNYMITEPRDKQLLEWLQKHGFVES
ncbi:MAG: glutaredoxin family protein [Chloroflexota bacterium]